MYHLRRHIRNPEMGVEKGWKLVKDELGENLESILDEALLSKCPEDGQNLLMYAAAHGNEEWFLHLIDHIRSQLGIPALVTELREIDIDGCPLLFHAASSNCKYSCFRTAKYIILSVLGKGELVQQFELVDGLGRGILMHAARSNHVDNFKEVFNRCREVADRMRPHDEPTVGGQTESLDPQLPATDTASADIGLLREVLGKADRIGKNCLHHAAEAGSYAVLHEVVKLCCSVYEEMNTADIMGRTPIMYVLRNDSCRGQEQQGSTLALKEESLRKKFHELYEALQDATCPQDTPVKTGWMEPSRVPPPSLAVPKGTRVDTRAVTELMHAARGGLVSLELALNKLPLASRNIAEGGFTVALDNALAVNMTIGNTQEQSHRTKAWGWALLLAAAAKLGDIDVLYHVLLAIKKGKFTLVKHGENDHDFRLAKVERPAGGGWVELPRGDRVQEAVRAINTRGKSVFSYAILSGRTDAMELVYDLVRGLFGDKTSQTWDTLSGKTNKSSSLTCAASASMEADNHGITMFDKVFSLLQQQTDDRLLVQRQLSPRFAMPHRGKGKVKISPLVGAAFSSNWILFRKVYDTYEEWTGHRWWRQQVLAQIPSGPPRRRSVLELQEMHDCEDDIPALIIRGAWSIPAVMWRDIVKAYQRAQLCSPDATSRGVPQPLRINPLPSWRDEFKGYSRRAVKEAAKRGTFRSLRDLVQEGFPLHEHHIPALLENIGDHEKDIIETILATVTNASNPFAMGAGLSRTLRTSEVDHPMHQLGLRRLQSIIDDFTMELLDKLPRTVRGMGMELIGGHQPITFGEGFHQGKHHRLGNLAGFIAVQWFLEPRVLLGDVAVENRYKEPDYIDPLRRALDRGSKGLYKYDDFETYKLSEILSTPVKPPTANQEGEQSPAQKEGFISMTFLLRLLQGWDHRDPKRRCNFPSRVFRAKGQEASGAQAPQAPAPPAPVPPVQPVSAAANAQAPASRPEPPNQWRIPHSTMLPGLQFSLAGIQGKPETFYKVPVIRFAFEIFSYLVMLVLFCFSVLLKEHDSIPWGEVTFYVFAAGLLWREILEFRDGMPARRHKPPKRQVSKNDGSTRTGSEQPLSFPRISRLGTGNRFNRMVSAFTRYVFYDTWNFLDTSTIGCILVAFIFRMIALDDKFFLFHAQFFYALSAPLLFSRLLVLSQIDATLGPMTQVIWRMMSHTLRFSAFIAMVMLSFALAFHAVFHTCGEYSEPQCTLDDDDAFPLRDAFGTFGDSFVTVFTYALGGPDFEAFQLAGSDCRCDLPEGARNAGIFLLVVYMITMTVVLLNLLIAVLSTTHGKVYANAEKEFHHARARLIYQSARVVSRSRPPPPLNLIKLVCGILLDAGTEVWRVGVWVTRGRSQARMLKPFSTTHQWKTLEGGLQRLEFAFTFGVAAVGLSTILWIVSVPWVAWCLHRLVHKAEEETEAEAEANEPDDDGSSTSERDDGDDHDDDGDDVDDDKEKPHLGYFRRFLSGIKSMCSLLVAMVAASFLCLLYIFATMILWAVGIWMVVTWVYSNWDKKNGDMPEPMPGQEDGHHWKRAWELASLRNQGARANRGQAHFHIAPLLKSKTGLDMQHLAQLTKNRHDESNSEAKLIEVDQKLPYFAIDLGHLQKLAKEKTEKKRTSDPATTMTRDNRVVGGAPTRGEGGSPGYSDVKAVGSGSGGAEGGIGDDASNTGSGGIKGGGDDGDGGATGETPSSTAPAPASAANAAPSS
ncbi:Ankyrin Repeat Transient Receptor Potential Channel [Ectocarpus siliculosus]|uniref:Ankyrin Repeat Transient Receptor Potential Channel n=1 Tax=Ectocarpus siliculosus TaxID=2880 RepID=D8LH99_ECTSI|nr:Ankyrin Repeat Transient Receptor Potential Channel [Ectocarpus siliculosus]|eukprot:CBN74318.1 Ankyrin Repeat Transient Receptor Potential Channel [Ectocarpus siliculosus]